MGDAPHDPHPFHGAKAAILIGDRLLVTLRDDFDWIDFPGCWDLPGGGREGAETPRETAVRETREEVGLDLGGADWLWARAFPSSAAPAMVSWFFAVRLPAAAERDIVLGDEGQGWRLMAPADFVAMEGAVPVLQERVAVWLSSLGDGAWLP